MFSEDSVTNFPQAINRSAPGSDLYYAQHFGRAVVLGLLRHDLSPEKAGWLAHLAASYGRRALDRQAVLTRTVVAIGRFGVR